MRDDIHFAELLAERLHDGQTDKQGKLYILHLRRVAARVRMAGFSQLVPEAYLHDTVEDGRCSLAFLGTARFSPDTLNNIWHLTRDVMNLEIGGHSQPHETYRDYIVRVAASERASIIKLADFLDNLSRNAELTAEDRERLGSRYFAAIRTLLGRWPILSTLYPETSEIGR